MVAIGIDLGTTYSCVAVWKEGFVEVIANDQGNRTTPSYVSFTKNSRVIGEEAKNQAPFNPWNTVFGTKRLIGRRYDDVGVQMDLHHWPYVVLNNNGKPKILVEYKGQKKQFAPEEISSMVICRMKEIAEVYLGEKIKDAVVTVPAYFNDAQRQATRAAGAIAGLNVIKILNEPTAAALAYGLDRNLKGETNVLIYDLGGGTLDVSVLSISESSVYEVKATSGNTRLGGEDFDNRLVAFFAEDFRKKYHIDLVAKTKALRRLKKASERAKKALTSSIEAIIQIESLCNGIDYQGRITRTMFEDLCSDLFTDTLKPVHQVLNDAKKNKTDINHVILVGGSTRIPKIRSMLTELFDGKTLTSSINPDEAIACGAAIQAAILSGDNHDKIQDFNLVDVVPLTLGVEAARGMMFKVVNRNTPIPCRVTKELTTLDDYQTAMTIEIFEGERTQTKDNNLLGAFDLNGIPPAPRGIAKIDVTFDIDFNGVLSVYAQDRSTGNMESRVIRNSDRLNQQEIEKMIVDAEIFKEEDKETHRRLDARNQLESYIYSVKQSVVDESGNLTALEKKSMVGECQNALVWLEGNMDCLREEFERKMSELLRKWSGIMKKIYGERWRHAKRQRMESEQSTATIEEVFTD